MKSENDGDAALLLNEAAYKSFMEVIGMKKIIDIANLDVVVETSKQSLWPLAGTSGYDD